MAIAAVALCVFTVVVVMTVMNGLVKDFREKNHRFVGDCVVSTDSLVGFSYYRDFLDELEKQDFVAATSPVVHGYGILAMPNDDRNFGVEVMGIDPQRHCRAVGFADSLYYRRDNPHDMFKPKYDPKLNGIIIGIDKMGRRSSSGKYYHSPEPDRLELMLSCFPLTARGALAKAGTDLVNTMSFHFSDDSHTGLVKVDGNMVYIPLGIAQQMLGMAGATPRINAIHIKFAEDTTLPRGCDRVREIWKGFVESHKDRANANLFEQVRVESWIENRRGTIAPMEKEQTMLIVLFLMLGVITVFVIFVVFYMIISHKSKDIGILKSLGAGVFDIVHVFLIFAAIIGLLGTAVGMAGGCVLLAYANNLEGWLNSKFGWEVWNRQIYAIGEIPSQIDWHVMVAIAASAVGACLLGAVVPSLQAARRRPVDILRVDQL